MAHLCSKCQELMEEVLCRVPPTNLLNNIANPGEKICFRAWSFPQGLVEARNMEYILP